MQQRALPIFAHCQRMSREMRCELTQRHLARHARSICLPVRALRNRSKGKAGYAQEGEEAREQDPHLPARVALVSRSRAGQAPARPFRGRALSLQCAAGRGNASPASDAGGSGMAGGARHSQDAQAGTQRGLRATAAYLRLFGLCPAELCQRSQSHLDC